MQKRARVDVNIKGGRYVTSNMTFLSRFNFLAIFIFLEQAAKKTAIVEEGMRCWDEEKRN